MMKINSKFLVRSTVGALLVALALPIVSFGATTTVSGGFCANIDQFIAKINTQVADKQDKFTTAKDERATKLEAKFVEKTQKLVAHRTESDVKRGEQLKKLGERAVTDVQKQAVATFETTMKNAITARRTAVDKAIADFKTGIQAAVGERKTTADVVVKSFTDSIGAALTEAKNECASGTDSKVVRATLQSKLKVFREKFQNDRKAVEKLNVKIQPLIDARKAAIEKAHADFKTTVEKARVDLKVAFPKTDKTATSTATTTTP